MRELLISVGVAAAVTGVAGATGLFMFLGTVVHPAFYLIAAFLILGAVAGGLWVWHSSRDEGPDDATAVIPRVEPIRPAAARGPRSVGRWLRHRRQGIKEVAR